MHLKKIKRNGRTYLSVVQNYREGGTTKTKTVETIGYADEYDKDYADPVAHFEAYVARLNDRKKREELPVAFSFPRNCTIDGNRTESARWGAGIALAYLDALEAKAAVARERGTGADAETQAARVFELFATERILHATPKRETWERRESFPRACDFSLAEAYRALSAIAATDRTTATRMRRAYERIRPDHAPARCVYVILETFAFADTDDVDAADAAQAANGETAVCLAMVLDEDGMPATYRLLAADPDARAIDAACRDVKSSLGAQRIVLVAGRLRDADAIAETLAIGGDGFIMHRSLATAVADMRCWAADDDGYTTSHSGNYRIKSRIRPMADFAHGAHDAESENAEEHAGAVRDIVLWGRDYALRTKARRGKARPAEQSLDGYACLVTSETHMPAADVFHLYRELWRLVEPFQVLESDFSPSPYPTPRADHIRAHFSLCYAAFFALRLMRSDLRWRYNAAQVAEALVRMEGGYLAENWFLFGYRSPVSDAIENAVGVAAARRLRTRQDIRRGIAEARRHIRREP